MNRWNWFTEQIMIFGIFGALYYSLELIYDGTSHWGMFVCAGLTGVTSSYILKHYNRLSMVIKALLITMVILILEFISGYILNIYFNLNVWDYSLLPFNLYGQICLYFGLIWFFLFGPFIFWLEPAIKWILFNAKKPKKIRRYYYEMLIDIKKLFHIKTNDKKAWNQNN